MWTKYLYFLAETAKQVQIFNAHNNRQNRTPNHISVIIIKYTHKWKMYICILYSTGSPVHRHNPAMYACSVYVSSVFKMSLPCWWHFIYSFFQCIVFYFVCSIEHSCSIEHTKCCLPIAKAELNIPAYPAPSFRPTCFRLTCFRTTFFVQSY